MLITKTSPIGIDYVIQKLQTYLHGQLLTTWGIDSADYESYGRCYRNKKDNGYVAEVFNGSDYKEVYWQDGLKAISFFGLSEKVRVQVGEKANVHLVFFVDLSKLKPLITHRADEEVRADVTNLVEMHGFELQSIDMWLENVLKEYPGSYRDERLKFVDMHPIHCFRLNLLINYQINKNC